MGTQVVYIRTTEQFCDAMCCFAVAVPYYFAFGNVSYADAVLINPEIINVTILTDLTKKFASSGCIDPTRTMLEDRVFIWTGANDTLTSPGHAPLFC